MNAIEDAEAMLRMAYLDFRALTGMENRDIFADEIFGFHAQQAIEKGFKAWLCVLVGQYPLTHDLYRLSKLLENKGCDIEKYFPLTQYSIFAVQARYEEGLLFTEEPLDRPSLITEVQDLLEHVEQTIQSSKP